VAIVAIMLVATFFNPSCLFASFPIDPGKISLSGTKVVMELPRVSGFTSDSRPYELTARAAAQDLTKPDILEPKDIATPWLSSRMGSTSPSSPLTESTTPKGDLLRLNDHITLNSTSGYEGLLSEAPLIWQRQHRFPKARRR